MKRIFIIALASLFTVAIATSCGNTDEDESDKITHLDAPSNVIAKRSGNSVIISWNPVQGADYYEVHKTTSESYNPIALGVYTTSCQDDDYSTCPKYKVIAVKGTIKSSSVATGRLCIKPPAPTITNCKRSGYNINMSWSQVVGTKTYAIEYYSGGIWLTCTPSGGLSGTSNSYVVETTSNKGTYRFRVRAEFDCNALGSYGDTCPGVGTSYSPEVTSN